ncbi:hypothetical protein BDQ12DRAFT_677875 [Crucibulum laeve]|uniref:MYND-type domain-containing protein n=1 Tax=Crucibulum laeve TaxID=68775 RepID=A0A5C3MBH0_9AGAR|nr:hypothetical protein BDQ12DRAFT_677875 [Crucibulum laeve]
MEPLLQAVFEMAAGFGRPDKDVDRDGWNNKWEESLAVFEQYRSNPKHELEEPTNAPQNDSEILDVAADPSAPAVENQADHLFRKSDILLSVQTFSMLYMEQKRASAGIHFRDAWVSMTTEKERAEIVLEALYQASSRSKETEICRQWCPDSTVEHLSSSPWTVVNLSYKMASSEGLLCPLPRYPPHPIVSQLMQTSALRSLQTIVQLQRAHFMTLLFWNILLAFYKGSEALEIQALTMQASPETKKYLRELTEVTDFCWNCSKSKVEDVELSACAKCQSVRIRTCYCSRECQRKDWIRGDPKPHKDICGQSTAELFNEDAMYPNPKPNRDINRQIEFLRKNPECDYAFWLSSKPAVMFTCSQNDPHAREEFIAARRQAMRTRSKKAVTAMCRLVLPWMVDSDITWERAARQLYREYGHEIMIKDIQHYHIILINYPKDLKIVREFLKGKAGTVTV